MLWWWVGNAVLALVVIPAVLVVAESVMRPTIEIKRYAADILENGLKVTTNLDPVPALADTRRLVGDTLAGVARYGAALDELL